MIKKKFICICVFLVLLVCIFCGCGTKSENYEENVRERFVIVEYTQKFVSSSGKSVQIYTVVDTETRIMYICCASSDILSFETMLNADGTPKIYGGEL